MIKKEKKIHNQTGKNGERFVQQSLWRRNIRVKNVALMGLGFDLLVKDKYRVEVKCTTKTHTPITIYPDKFDVLCIVFLNQLERTAYYLRKKEYLQYLFQENSQNVVFLNPKKIHKYFIKNPKEIFNK